MSRLRAMTMLNRAVRPSENRVEVIPRPTWKDMRRICADAAEAAGEWGGAPMPVEESPLVLEPRYPYPQLRGAKLSNGRIVYAEKDEPKDFTVVNSWFCKQYQAQIVVIREADGRTNFAMLHEGPGLRLRYWFMTVGVAVNHAWDIDVENRAVEKLASLITPHALHCYQLTGGFLETSKRSGVTYLFRKLRPTIAMRPDKRNLMTPIAVLCLHPLGYYAETWAGVMCPTDDVVAHLMLMRGDEHGFWKKANHHSVWQASAGI